MTAERWRHVIWSDESSFTIVSTNQCVHMWRQPRELYSPERVVPTVEVVDDCMIVLGHIFLAWPGSTHSIRRQD